jgi:hypothetical protein
MTERREEGEGKERRGRREERGGGRTVGEGKGVAGNEKNDTRERETGRREVRMAGDAAVAAALWWR